MKRLKKFSLNETDRITNDEMKIVRGGIPSEEPTLYDCFVKNNVAFNVGEKCIYDLQYKDNERKIILGTCKSMIDYVIVNKRPEPRIIAYCEMDDKDPFNGNALF